MKKILALVLAAMMLLGCCSALADDPPLKQPLIEAANALKPSENLYFENGLEITGVGMIYNNYPTAFDGCYLWPAIKNLTNTTVNVDWRVEDNYSTQIATILASGKLPDIITAGAYGVSNLADEGAIIPLDDYLDLIPNIVEAVGEDRMAKWRSADGHVYTIPTIVNVPGSQTVMIRKDWLDALNMSEPQTWEDWVALWRAIKANDLNGNGDPNDEIPLALEQGATGERSLASLLHAFGIKCSSDCQFCVLDDGTYCMVYDHPRYPEFLKAVQELYAEGLLDQGFAKRTQAELFTIMDSNLVGTCMTWAERCRISTNALRELGDEDALWIAVPPITGPYGDQMTQEREAVTGLWCITTAAEKAGKVEDILKWFNWFWSEEGNNLYNFGIEGVSYDMVDGEAHLKPEMVANGFVDYRQSGCEFEPFGNEWQTAAFMQCLFAGQPMDNLDDASASFYAGLAVVNNGKFYSMPQTLATPEYTEYRAELITTGVCVLRDQAVVGQLSVEDFFAQYETLKTRGLQEVIDAGAESYAVLAGK
jgi:putative aldouronate transport system substrate-binding protein